MNLNTVALPVLCVLLVLYLLKRRSRLSAEQE